MTNIFSSCLPCFNRSSSPAEEHEMQDLPPRRLSPGPAAHDAFESQLNAPAPGSSPPHSLPRLDTSMLQGPRLGAPELDADTPVSPNSSILNQYRDPQNLPGPTGTAEHHGEKWDTYGTRTEVLQGFPEHQVLRQRMAATASGRKYLAVAENPTEPSRVTIMPYRSSDIKNAIRTRDIHGNRLKLNQPQTNRIPVEHGEVGAEHRIVSAYPIDEGAALTRGGAVSAATLGQHEMRHVAQFAHKPDEPLDDFPLPGWHTDNEKSTITKGDNPTALAHGEGLRDDHLAEPFRTNGFTSITPADPRVAEILGKYQPDLRQQTAELDRLGIDASNPKAKPGGAELTATRLETNKQMAEEMRGTLSPLEQITRLR